MSIITSTTLRKSSQGFTSLINEIIIILVFKSLYHAYKCTGDKVIILNIAPPEILRKETEDAKKLCAPGFDKKHIYAAL